MASTVKYDRFTGKNVHLYKKEQTLGKTELTD